MYYLHLVEMLVLNTEKRWLQSLKGLVFHMKKTELFFIHINSFIEHMKTELKSDKTIETYINGLNSFRKYLTEVLNMDIEKMTFNDINDNIIRYI